MRKEIILTKFFSHYARHNSEKLLSRLDLNIPSQDDPLGSYTGNPASGEKPQQDADDL